MPKLFCYEIVEGGFQFVGNPKQYILHNFLLIRELVARRQKLDESTESQATRKVLKQLLVDVVGISTIENIYVGMNTVCEKNPEIKKHISKWWGAFQKHLIEHSDAPLKGSL